MKNVKTTSVTLLKTDRAKVIKVEWGVVMSALAMYIITVGIIPH